MQKENRSTMTREELEALFVRHAAADFKWINPAADIVVAQWVRMKCMFGCNNYGHNASCPPNTPSVEDCRRLFEEYTTGALFHFPHRVDKPEDRRPWAVKLNRELLGLEREVFLAGYPKAFLLVMDSCHLCADCTGRRTECRNAMSARPGPDAMAIDVFSTVRQAGYPIEVLSDYTKEMNRYAFLLIE
jgi:predicted metal-binding protein